jgi:integrase
MAETGAEEEEIHKTHKNQIDTEQGIISIRGTKGHASAQYKLKPQTAEMLRLCIHRNPQEYLFPPSGNMGDAWRNARRKAMKTLCKPELDKIELKSLRNYSGAMLYYRLQDPIAVMRHLRHKKLETTMHYIRGITITGEEEYTCKAAHDIKEATALIEAGFQYVTEMDGLKLFRKRK